MFSMLEHRLYNEYRCMNAFQYLGVDLYLDFSEYNQHIYPLKALNGSMFFDTPYSENEG